MGRRAATAPAAALTLVLLLAGGAAASRLEAAPHTRTNEAGDPRAFTSRENPWGEDSALSLGPQEQHEHLHLVGQPPPQGAQHPDDGAFGDYSYQDELAAVPRSINSDPSRASAELLQPGGERRSAYVREDAAGRLSVVEQESRPLPGGGRVVWQRATAPGGGVSTFTASVSGSVEPAAAAQALEGSLRLVDGAADELLAPLHGLLGLMAGQQQQPGRVDGPRGRWASRHDDEHHLGSPCRHHQAAAAAAQQQLLLLQQQQQQDQPLLDEAVLSMASSVAHLVRQQADALRAGFFGGGPPRAEALFASNGLALGRRGGAHLRHSRPQWLPAPPRVADVDDAYYAEYYTDAAPGALLRPLFAAVDGEYDDDLAAHAAPYDGQYDVADGDYAAEEPAAHAPHPPAGPAPAAALRLVAEQRGQEQRAAPALAVRRAVRRLALAAPDFEATLLAALVASTGVMLVLFAQSLCQLRAALHARSGFGGRAAACPLAAALAAAGACRRRRAPGGGEEELTAPLLVCAEDVEGAQEHSPRRPLPPSVRRYYNPCYHGRPVARA